jgi:hypothetical protein
MIGIGQRGSTIGEFAEHAEIVEISKFQRREGRDKQGGHRPPPGE